MYVLSVTLTQLKTVLFCRAYKTLPQHLLGSLGCKADVRTQIYLLGIGQL